ncbi:hypothetical protein AB0P36_31515 [Streptomyces flavidovirens]
MTEKIPSDGKMTALNVMNASTVGPVLVQYRDGWAIIDLYDLTEI